MTEQYKDLSLPTPRFSTHTEERPRHRFTHNVKVSLYLGAQLLFLDLVAYFLFLSLRWGPMMYTSTNGRKIPCVCHLRSLAATTDAGGKWDKTSVEIKRANDVKEKKKRKGGGISCSSSVWKRNVKTQYVSLPLTVTLCSPVLGWVKISTWMDTSPTASSTPEPDRVERQHEAPWVSLTWGNVSFLSQSKQTHANHRCYILLLLPKHDATHRPNPVRCINGPAYSNTEWTKLACFQLITCYRRTRNEPSDLRVCILWSGQPVKAAMSGLCLFVSVMLAIHCSAVHLQYT